jgi:hypothetical protein
MKRGHMSLEHRHAFNLQLAQRGSHRIPYTVPILARAFSNKYPVPADWNWDLQHSYRYTTCYAVVNVLKVMRRV